MKTLFLLRHAKTERNAASGIDFDRELTDRGRSDSRKMGKALARLAPAIDHILCSPAARARQTVEHLLAKYPKETPLRFCRDIYAAEARSLLDIVRTEAEGNATLLVGHNPGIEQFAGLVTAGVPRGARFPTAGLARIELEFRDWAELTESAGSLTWLLTPEVVASL